MVCRQNKTKTPSTDDRIKLNVGFGIRRLKSVLILKTQAPLLVPTTFLS